MSAYVVVNVSKAKLLVHAQCHACGKRCSRGSSPLTILFADRSYVFAHPRCFDVQRLRFLTATAVAESTKHDDRAPLQRAPGRRVVTDERTGRMLQMNEPNRKVNAREVP